MGCPESVFNAGKFVSLFMNLFLFEKARSLECPSCGVTCMVID